MNLSDYKYLLGIARRHVRVADEAEDLLQEALIVAVEQGRLDFETDENQRWLAGVIKNLATMQARSAWRRKQREENYADDKSDLVAEASTDAASERVQHWLKELPASARKVAVLIMHGLNRQEICTLLGIADTAFRQRLTVLRRTLNPQSSDLRSEAMAMAYASRLSSNKENTLPLGLIRKALINHLKSLHPAAKGTVGTHDPSGHLIVIRGSVKK